jgi:hypothetical protein
VRRIVLNPLLGFVFLLPGVAVKTYRNSGIVLCVGLQGFELTVDKRVHRINNDCANLVLLRLCTENVIHNWNQVGYPHEFSEVPHLLIASSPEPFP